MNFCSPTKNDDSTEEVSLNFSLTPFNSNQKIEQTPKIKPIRMHSQPHRMLRQQIKEGRPKSTKPIIRRPLKSIKTHELPRLTKKTQSTIWQAFENPTISKQKLQDMFIATIRQKLESMRVQIRFRYPNKKSGHPKKKLQNLNMALTRVVV